MCLPSTLSVDMILLIIHVYAINLLLKGKFEDTKGVIRSNLRDRQYNRKKKYKIKKMTKKHMVDKILHKTKD